MIDTKNMNTDAFSDERNTAQVKVILNGTQVITRENIISAKLQEDLADKNITIGAAFSQSFEMNMRMPTSGASLKGAYLIPEASFNGSEWARLGKFYVSSVSTSDNYKTVSITAVDRMALLTEQYIPKVNLPTTPQEIIEDIAAQYNIELDHNITYADLSINQLYEAKVRDYIGWIAGLSGKNARFNREGKLTFTWYRQIIATYGDVNMDDIIDTDDIDYINNNLLGSATEEQYEAILGRMIVGKAYIGAELKDAVKALLADVDQNGIVNSDDTAEIQAYIDGTPYAPTIVGTVKEYMQLLNENHIERNGFVLSAAELYTISALISGTDDNPVESGTGKAINFFNPYINQTILDEIASEILPFTYLAAEVTYRGNPAWEVGDIIRVESGEGYNIPIMSQTVEFGSKLSAVIKSYGASDEEESSTRVVPDIKEVQRQLPEIKQILSDINESLLSGDAGYMEFIMETIDGIERLSGFRIMDTPVLTDSTKGWQANKNGIGWSSDGFKSISKLGLDMANGKIYADEIAAGSIITNSFKIGDAMSFNGATGEITFGSKVKMNWESIEDHPTNLSDLNNDEGFIDSSAATVITNNAISTASIRADQIQAGSFTMTGGNISISTDDSSYSPIVINYMGRTTKIDGQDIINEYDDITAGLRYNTIGFFLSNVYQGGMVFENDGVSFLGNYASFESIKEGGEYLSNKYAPSSHTHSQYYSSGDNIYANAVYIKNASTISGDPNARLAVTSPYQIGYASGSSRKFKHDIKPVENIELDPTHLYDIEVVQFKYNDDYLESNDQRYGIDCIGFIAEQVNEVYPIAADKETGEPRNWEMRYIIPPMLALIQQQKKEIDELREKIERLVN